MKFEFKPSFDRSVKSLPSKTKKEIKELCIGHCNWNEGSFGNGKEHYRLDGVSYTVKKKGVFGQLTWLF